MARVGPVDQVDCRHAGAQERSVVIDDRGVGFAGEEPRGKVGVEAAELLAPLPPGRLPARAQAGFFETGAQEAAVPGRAAPGDPLLGFRNQGVAAGGGIRDAPAQQRQMAALAAGGPTGGGEAERGDPAVDQHRGAASRVNLARLWLCS